MSLIKLEIQNTVFYGSNKFEEMESLLTIHLIWILGNPKNRFLHIVYYKNVDQKIAKCCFINGLVFFDYLFNRPYLLKDNRNNMRKLFEEALSFYYGYLHKKKDLYKYLFFRSYQIGSYPYSNDARENSILDYQKQDLIKTEQNTIFIRADISCRFKVVNTLNDM